MNNSDKLNFVNLMNATSEYYQQQPISVMAAQMYFSALTDYSLEEVTAGITKHLQNHKSGQFYPKAADIIRYITGGDMTADKIIAMARVKNCPLGVLAYLKIGSWDLDRGDSYYLKQRAEECILMLPEWKSNAETNTLTDHEVRTMIKYGVGPNDSFELGIEAPKKTARRLEIEGDK